MKFRTLNRALLVSSGYRHVDERAGPAAVRRTRLLAGWMPGGKVFLQIAPGLELSLSAADAFRLADALWRAGRSAAAALVSPELLAKGV